MGYLALCLQPTTKNASKPIGLFVHLIFTLLFFLSHRRADNDTGEKVRFFDFVFQSSALTSDVV